TIFCTFVLQFPCPSTTYDQQLHHRSSFLPPMLLPYPALRLALWDFVYFEYFVVAMAPLLPCPRSSLPLQPSALLPSGTISAPFCTIFCTFVLQFPCPPTTNDQQLHHRSSFLPPMLLTYPALRLALSDFVYFEYFVLAMALLV